MKKGSVIFLLLKNHEFNNNSSWYLPILKFHYLLTLILTDIFLSNWTLWMVFILSNIYSLYSGISYSYHFLMRVTFVYSNLLINNGNITFWPRKCKIWIISELLKPINYISLLWLNANYFELWTVNPRIRVEMECHK